MQPESQHHNNDIPGSSHTQGQHQLGRGRETRKRICILDDTGFAIMIQRHGLAKSQMCLFIRHKLSRSRAEERAARVVLGLGLGPPRIRSPVPANDKCTGRVTITKEPVQECYGSSRNSKAALICPHPLLESPQIFVPIREGGLNLFCCSTKIEKVTSSQVEMIYLNSIFGAFL